MNRIFWELIAALWAEGKFLCVGLDSDWEKIPDHIKRNRTITEAILWFNKAIIKAVAPYVCCFKPNIAFYEAMGVEGIEALKETISYIHRKYPNIPVILDAKRADIGNTNNGYAKFAFDVLGADAITVHPYLGKKALQPFFNYEGKGIIVLCHTSNPGANEFQDLTVYRESELCDEIPQPLGKLFQFVGLQIATQWNDKGNCGIVMGATYPEQLSEIRKSVGDLPILIPGIGTQGGEIEKAVLNGLNSRGDGAIFNSSSAIIFASNGEDFAEKSAAEAEKTHLAIVAARKKFLEI